ncbi:sensor histidine kinase [Brevibacterium sp. VCM10]|uniref:sensor histidine kinase n=1 Tax=Brevibacterium sp. VCM10 TaxID=1381751 RepID=UPI00046E5CD1|nr:sensor histidine kinase [Brevibacterium sp. VCM10]
MSEKTPENPQDQEPFGPDPQETHTPEREELISAADIVNAPPTTEVDAEAVDEPTAREAGEFRTKPVDPAVPFATGSTRVMGAGDQSQSPGHPPNYPAPPAYAPQPGPAPHPGQQFSGPAPTTYPGQPAPNARPMPAAQPMPRPRPPRRVKPKREPVAYAPVTGSLPLSRDEVTEIPADGPITWPKRPTGLIGVANLVLSAVLAVIWAWIPLGLLFTGIGGIFALGLGVLALLVWVLVQQSANNAERYRAELIYSDKIPVPKIESSNRDPGFGRFLHNRWLQVKSGAFWRSTAHHYIKMLLGAIVVAGTLAGICGSIFGIFAAINPHGVNTFFIGESIDGSARIGVAIGSVIVLASSLAILWFAPLLDRALDRALLAPARTVALQAEVTELDRARMAGLEAAAAERLRIERDLHDGAQPRLVALTMTLGMAKTKIDSDPEKAKELVAEAHTEAKGIVNELRQLARGIHPAVLTDRGLDAAVSALAGRSTIPVDVDVRLDGRIGREAEAVSYFVVAECLTNIAKHSGATRASVFIAPIETGVQIVVTDNGHGGARVDRTGRHTGIAGLIDRVEAARGTLNLTSPAGGPTTVVVEVPCAS